MRRIHRRPDGSYTMRADDGSVDGSQLPLAQPPRFSVDDRFARFRYEEKHDEWSQDS